MAYSAALDDCTPYQLGNALAVELKRPRDWPVSAGELREIAKRFDRTAEAKQVRLYREAEAKRLPSPEETHRRNMSVGEAMRDECRRIIREGSEGEAEFCASLLKGLESDKSNDPGGTLIATLFGGVTKR